MSEPRDEPADRLAQGILRIDLDKTPDINEGEQEVSKFILHAPVVLCLECLLKFLHLLDHLGEDLICVLPIKTDPCRPRLQLMCPQEGRQVRGDPFEDGLPLFPLLYLFYRLPLSLDLVCVLCLLIAEYMRMATDHLLTAGRQYIFNVKLAFLLADLCMEQDLIQQVSQLFL